MSAIGRRSELGSGRRRAAPVRPRAVWARSAGWTLVETLLATSVTLTALGLALSFLASGQRDGQDLAFRLHTLRSAHILREHLASDLASALAAVPRERPVVDSRSLAFTRISGAGTRGAGGTCLDGRLARITEQVRYTFDPKRRVVVRTCGGASRAVGAGPFLDVAFSYRPWSGSGGAGDAVIVRVVTVPEGCLRTPASIDETTPRVEQTFTLPGGQTSRWGVYDEWAF